MIRLLLLSVLFVLSMSAQPYTCPETPTWSTVACSVWKTFEPVDDGIPYYMRKQKPRYNRYDRWAMEMEGIPDLEVLIWHGRYEDPERIAELVGKSISVLPPIVLRSLPVNTVISMDQGSSGGAIYWDLPRERAHAIEFAHTFAHESYDVLDWSYEELLLHEIGHVFDSGLYCIRDNLEWVEATRLDITHVSSYANNSLKEAFAETFAAWFAYRRDQARPLNKRKLTKVHTDKIKATISHRGAWLDKQILKAVTAPNGRLFSDLSLCGDTTVGEAVKRAAEQVALVILNPMH